LMRSVYLQGAYGQEAMTNMPSNVQGSMNHVQGAEEKKEEKK